jgi:rSAM/selenodomain-associated transferase 2
MILTDLKTLSTADCKSFSLSVIIPVRNEEQAIGSCLDQLSGQPDLEILVVDGGSSDQTIARVEERGLQALVSAPGRGSQQRYGAARAGGEVLLFLHCDTRLPEDFREQIRITLAGKGVAAGAFQLAINARGMGFRVVEYGVRLRSRLLQLPYGDQALFMTGENYLAAGGFPDQPIMEELPLLAGLKKLGQIRIAPAPVTTSARRWQEHGIVKTLLINQIMVLGRTVGVSPERLAGWYYGR